MQLFGRTSSLILQGTSAISLHRKKGAGKTGKSVATREYKQPYDQAVYDQIASDASWKYEDDKPKSVRRKTYVNSASSANSSNKNSAVSSNTSVNQSDSSKLRKCVERMLHCDNKPQMVSSGSKRVQMHRGVRRTSEDCFYKRNDEVGGSPIYPIGEESMD